LNIKAVWKNEEQFGVEYLMLLCGGIKITAKGTIIYEDEGHSDAHIVNYKIELDGNWVTKKLTLEVDEVSRLEILSDGLGNWFNAEGNSIDHLKGAIDIDISATPFSNSLPVNRMVWNKNQQHHFEVVYLSVPTLAIKKVPQSYKYIKSDGELRYFNYRCYEYETTICVDQNGLVISYPNVFSRRL
jgi:uncharacterized protein